MGELTPLSSGSLSTGLISGLFSLAALALFALLRPESGDDDDSTPGGGLMQPVA
ncbi:MAG: hypothetical protein ACKOPT_03345 [Cyanobium sp.]